MQRDKLHLHDRCLAGKRAALIPHSSFIILLPHLAQANEMQAIPPSVPRLHFGDHRKRRH
jgi:hypothetical protein